MSYLGSPPESNPKNLTVSDISGLGNSATLNIASQSSAEAGIVNNELMSPLRTKQELLSLIPTIASQFPGTRQTVISGPTGMINETLYAKFLPSTTVSLSVSLTGVSNTSPFAWSIANGATDINGRITNNGLSWSNLKPYAINYLFIDENGNTGSTTIPPSYYDGAQYPINKSVLVHFNGDTNNVYGGATNLFGTAALTATNPKFGSQCLSIPNTTSGLELVGPNVRDMYGWTSEIFFKMNGTGVLKYLLWGAESNAVNYGYAIEISAANYIRLYVSSNRTSWDIANGVQAASTFTDTTNYHHLALVFDGTSYKVYLDGTAIITVASSTQVNNIGIHNVMCAYNRTLGTVGSVDEVRISSFPRYLTNFAPSVTEFAQDETWDAFNIGSMTMASYPSVTPVKRVYVGDAKTSGSTVIETNCYSYKGTLTTGLMTTVAGTIYNVKHNMGLVPTYTDIKLVNISPDCTFIPGDEVSYYNIVFASNPYGPPQFPIRHTGVNGFNYKIMNANLAVYEGQLTNGFTGIVLAKWKIKFIVKRGW